MSLKKDVLIECATPVVSGMAMAILKANGFTIYHNDDPRAIDLIVDLLAKTVNPWTADESQSYLDRGGDRLIERVELDIIEESTYEEVVRVAEMNPFAGLPFLQFGYPEHGNGVMISREIALTYADDNYFCGYEVKSATGQPKKFLRSKIREYSLVRFAA